MRRLGRASVLAATGVFLLAGLALSACTGGSGPSGSTSASAASANTKVGGNSQAAKQGAIIYKKECESCHGAEGDRIPASPLNSLPFLNSRGDATLLAVVIDGKGTMPAYGKARGGPLTDVDVQGVVAYINAKAGRGSTTLLAAEGEKVYAQLCSSCHGPAGDRIPIAPLTSKGYLDSRTDAQLVDDILKGVGNMRGFGGTGKDSISTESATSVVSYLRYRVQAQTVQSVSHGRDLYVGNCLACHGTSGDRVKDAPLAQAAFLSKLGDGGVISAVSKGTKSGPAFGAEGGAFTIQDTAAVLAYLKSWAGMSATSALTTGATSGKAGEGLFVQNCSPCHGVTGDQVAGVQLKSQRFLTLKTKDVVKTTVKSGNKKGMPAWSQDAGGPFTEEQVNAVVEYLFASANPDGGAAASAGGASGGAAGGAAPAAKPSPFGSQTAAEFYGGKCAGCHGAERQGLVGPALKPARLTQPDDFYQKTILNGRPGTPMPAWGQQGVTAEQAAALVDFIKEKPGAAGGAASGGTTAAPSAAAAPSGGGDANAPVFGGKTAKEFFADKCAACHGADRKGLIGPALLPDKLTQPNDFYEKTILNGRPGTPMPAWGQQGVTAEQAKAMVAFLKLDPSKASAAPAGGGGGTAPAASASSTVPVSDAKPVLFGRDLFQGTCALCHGKDGLAQKKCPLGDREWATNTSEEGLIQKISKGKPDFGMPTWAQKYGGTLTDEQIRSVAAYVAGGIN